MAGTGNKFAGHPDAQYARLFFKDPEFAQKYMHLLQISALIGEIACFVTALTNDPEKKVFPEIILSSAEMSEIYHPLTNISYGEDCQSMDLENQEIRLTLADNLSNKLASLEELINSEQDQELVSEQNRELLQTVNWINSKIYALGAPLRKDLKSTSLSIHIKDILQRTEKWATHAIIGDLLIKELTVSGHSHRQQLWRMKNSYRKEMKLATGEQTDIEPPKGLSPYGKALAEYRITQILKTMILYWCIFPAPLDWESVAMPGSVEDKSQIRSQPSSISEQSEIHDDVNLDTADARFAQAVMLQIKQDEKDEPNEAIIRKFDHHPLTYFTCNKEDPEKNKRELFSRAGLPNYYPRNLWLSTISKEDPEYARRTELRRKYDIDYDVASSTQLAQLKKDPEHVHRTKLRDNYNRDPSSNWEYNHDVTNDIQLAQRLSTADIHFVQAVRDAQIEDIRNARRHHERHKGPCYFSNTLKEASEVTPIQILNSSSAQKSYSTI